MAKQALKSTETGVMVFHRRLHAWYAKCGRQHLPWRTARDPYAVYVSEIMLQQTQVETVLTRFYFPFLARFPTLSALAEAPLEDVLKAWQGLGYYTRARNLHKAAHAAAPHLPSTPDALQALPGIGKNTAHAVAAFGFGAAVPVMEANVKRVLSRIFALTRPDEKTLWHHAEALLDPANPFDYNQAMMDLGALTCTRTKPDCAACPANHFCAGQQNPQAYPAPKAAKQEKIRKKTILVHVAPDGRIHAKPRTSRFLNGMYHFEETETAAPHGATHLGHVRQVYSHFTLEAEVYLLKSKAGKKDWYSLEDLKKLPHSKAEEKIITLIEDFRKA